MKLKSASLIKTKAGGVMICSHPKLGVDKLCAYLASRSIPTGPTRYTIPILPISSLVQKHDNHWFHASAAVFGVMLRRLFSPSNF